MMSQAESTAVVGDQASKGSRSSARQGGGGGPAPAPGGGGGFFRQYKPDQGKWTRMGTFSGLLLLAAWGAKFLYDQLQVFEGDDIVSLLVTTGFPIAFLVVIGAVSWWATYSNRKSGDFMIGTEGEMKKVSWSSKGEIVGSTKVVIMFTVLLAATLFLVDLVFQALFSSIGVLKAVGG